MAWYTRENPWYCVRCTRADEKFSYLWPIEKTTPRSESGATAPMIPSSSGAAVMIRTPPTCFCDKTVRQIDSRVSRRAGQNQPDSKEGRTPRAAGLYTSSRVAIPSGAESNKACVCAPRLAGWRNGPTDDRRQLTAGKHECVDGRASSSPIGLHA